MTLDFLFEVFEELNGGSDRFVCNEATSAGFFVARNTHLHVEDRLTGNNYLVAVSQLSND